MDLDYEPEEEPTEEPELDDASREIEPAERRGGGRPMLWVALVLAVGGVAIALWLLGPEEAAGPPPQVAEIGVREEPAEQPQLDLGADLEEEAPIVIPPLEASDEVVRRLAEELSSHPALAEWIATDRLVRRFVAVVDNVAEGVDPRTHLPIRSLDEPFATTRGGGPTRIDPESYRRYDRAAALFVSLDPKGTARLYARLKPRIDEAYRDLGYPDRRFDDTLVRAIRHLLATPIPETPPILEARVRGWAYQDAGLEALSPAQKVLVRMGPDNARAVQNHLRRVAKALGVPDGRLGS